MLSRLALFFALAITLCSLTTTSSAQKVKAPGTLFWLCLTIPVSQLSSRPELLNGIVVITGRALSLAYNQHGTVDKKRS